MRKPISVHASAIGFRVGDGPFRLSSSCGPYDGDYYVVEVHENRLTLKPIRFGWVRRAIAWVRRLFS